MSPPGEVCMSRQAAGLCKGIDRIKGRMIFMVKTTAGIEIPDSKLATEAADILVKDFER